MAARGHLLRPSHFVGCPQLRGRAVALHTQKVPLSVCNISRNGWERSLLESVDNIELDGPVV